MRIEIEKQWLKDRIDIKACTEIMDQKEYHIIEIPEETYRLEIDQVDKNLIVYCKLAGKVNVCDTFAVSNDVLLELINKSDSSILMSVIGIITKKLNQFKALLESAHGLL